jgi:hypothetical protein
MMAAAFFQFDQKSALNAIESIVIFGRKLLTCRADEKLKIG